MLIGLEYATNLRSLSVGGNQVSDLTPLENLASLGHLYIGDNLISDISPLANLTNLKRLGMLRNQREIVVEITKKQGTGEGKGGERGNKFPYKYASYEGVAIENLTHPDRNFEEYE